MYLESFWKTGTPVSNKYDMVVVFILIMDTLTLSCSLLMETKALYITKIWGGKRSEEKGGSIEIGLSIKNKS